MASPFEGLQPESLWRHFEALTRIPRCSGNEAATAAHLLEFARGRNLAAEKDAAGNVVVRLPASPGKESAPGVVLQGHLDMVGEKDSSSRHDFARDPIPVVRRGEWLGADGTTLGADNGIGLAAALAILEEKNLVHGPIEILATVDEETGLTGAQNLKPGFVRGKILLNLDSEEEGAIYVGCAGGADTLLELPLARQPGKARPYRVHVHGLRGGHSGLDINTGRGNAIRVLAQFLLHLSREARFELCAFEGGNKHNAIPREAFAVIRMGDGARKKAEKLLQTERADLSAMFGRADSGVAIDIAPCEQTPDALKPRAARQFLRLVLALPHGVLAMSQDIPGLVESSTNLAVVRVGEQSALLHESSRSSVMPALRRIQEGIVSLGELSGARVEPKGGYPGWQPNMASAVLARARGVHQRLFGKEPAVKAIHAGLECGIIGEKCGGMDMISFGPQIESPHSPSERVHIESVGRFYQFLKALLQDLAG
jgi:dipeptidase D